MIANEFVADGDEGTGMGDAVALAREGVQISNMLEDKDRINEVTGVARKREGLTDAVYP